MKHFLIIIYVVALGLLQTAIAQTQTNQAKQVAEYNSYFEENRGQVMDEDFKAVTDVLYKANANGVQVYITTSGISYYFLQAENTEANLKPFDPKTAPTSKKHNWCRVDMELKNASIQKVNSNCYNQIGNASFNYYLTKDIQVSGLHRYQKLVIKNIYPGIDWVLYAQGQKGIKYDFVINPGADPNQIKLSYKGVEHLSPTEIGGYTLRTDLGELSESAPISFSGENKIATEFKIQGNDISFKLGNYNKQQALVIDPALVWGTYFGGNYDDWMSDMCTDLNNNMISVYRTFSNVIAPKKNPSGGAYYKGAMQNPSEAFIAKFDVNGSLLWGTYYGVMLLPIAMCSDSKGTVYLTGRLDAAQLNMYTALKDPGNGAYYVSTNQGLGDAYIAQFDLQGVLTWATLYSSSGSGRGDMGISVTCDAANNLYLFGFSDDTTLPLMPYSNPQALYSTVTGVVFNVPFMAKFSSTGVRKWCTYINGSGGMSGKIVANRTGDKIAFAGDGSVFKALKNPGGGATYNGTAPGWPPQAICEFDTSCVVTWGTYYGGSSWEWATGAAYDSQNNLYVIGNGNSINFPTVDPGNGAFMEKFNISAAFTGFIMKFDANKKIVWSSYLGSKDGGTSAYDIDVDVNDNVYCVGGVTKATFPIVNDATTLVNQATFGGGTTSDGFIMRFDKNCNLKWSTYVGGSTSDVLGALAFDKKQCVYFGGYSDSPSGPPIKNKSGAYNQSSPVNTSAPDGYIMKLCPTLLSVDTAKATFCSSSKDGKATAYPIGGASPYTYSWSNGQTDQVATGLAPGTYSFTITDATGLTTSDSVLIKSPKPMTIQSFPTQPSCGNNDGSLSINVTGVNPPYTYSWSGSAQTDFTATNLASGSYTVRVTDANGCTKDTTLLLNDLGGPAVSSYGAYPKCLGSNDGMITLSAGGGFTPYTYSWAGTSTNANAQTNAIATGLSAGTYTATTTDSKGCKFQLTIVLIDGVTINATATITPAACAGVNNGSATLNPVGGTSPYSYSWSPSGGSTKTATGLGPDIYTVTITDKDGCTNTKTVSISSVSTFTATATPTTANCFGGTGSATAAGSGGGTPYVYSWNNGATGATQTNLPIGNYTITISDKNGCSTTQTVMVTEPDSISVVGISIPSEKGVNTGEIHLAVSGGTSGYTYSWATLNATTQNLTGLAPGTYSVIVTDSKSCTKAYSIKVDENALCDYFIPTAFSPNDDGINDVFNVRSSCLKSYKLQVFNRWGELVFETTELTNSWNGVYRGTLENSAVFNYLFNGVNSKDEIIEKKGNVTLVR